MDTGYGIQNTVVAWKQVYSMVSQRALSYGQAIATEEINGSELETFTYRREAEIPPDLGEHSIPPAFPLWPLGEFGGGKFLTT